ncbi:MAG TPA: hypothetical protein VHB02_05980 [Acidimicrobiales bacterium]|nr:hypothetical protein [Acidimicrobiales bacterium]
MIVIVGVALAILRLWIRSVMREVRPNGGNSSSLGDTARRTEETLGRIEASQQAMDRRITGIAGDVAAANSKIDRHIGRHEALEALARQGQSEPRH